MNFINLLFCSLLNKLHINKIFSVAFIFNTLLWTNIFVLLLPLVKFTVYAYKIQDYMCSYNQKMQFGIFLYMQTFFRAFSYNFERLLWHFDCLIRNRVQFSKHWDCLALNWIFLIQICHSTFIGRFRTINHQKNLKTFECRLRLIKILT